MNTTADTDIPLASFVGHNTTTTVDNTLYDHYSGWDDPTIRAYHVLYRVSSLLSAFAALSVIVETWADHRAGVGTTVTRVLFIEMLSSLMFSITNSLGTWPIPAEYHEFIWGASGTLATCSLQGAVYVWSALSGMCWDMVLSLTYVWMVRYSWLDDKLRKAEKIAHAIIWPIIFGNTAAGFVTQSYNPNFNGCFLASVPYDCEGDECERGEYSWIVWLSAPLIALNAVSLSGTCMVLLYFKVRSTEERNAQYSSNLWTIGPSATPNGEPSSRMSRRVAVQGIIYSGSIFIVTLPLALVYGYSVATGHWNDHVGGVTELLSTFHGTLYMIIFFRKRDTSKTAYGRSADWLVKQIQSFCQAFFCNCCGCCCAWSTKGSSSDVLPPTDQL